MDETQEGGPSDDDAGEIGASSEVEPSESPSWLKRNARWVVAAGVTALVVAAVIVAYVVSDEDSEQGDEVSPGGKVWNAVKGIWEIDGEPVTYRVTWRNVSDGSEQSKVFTNIDHGYDFYKDVLKSAWGYGATWDHEPW